jgi:hypothetical protein
MAWKPVASRDFSRRDTNKLLSAGYREWLSRLVPEERRAALKLPEGATWIDAISQQLVLRAVGMVGKENICFTAITELRETTEGKTADKIISTGNEELAALAQAISGPPAPDPSS